MASGRLKINPLGGRGRAARAAPVPLFSPPPRSGNPYAEAEAPQSGFDLVGGGVPGDGGLPEIRLVGHVARERGVVAEDGVFGDLLVVARPLEKSPEVRFFFVPGSAAIGETFRAGFLPGLGVGLRVPLL